MNVIRCCGQENRSPFCSMCGRRLQAFPLSDLLIYCREQADKAEAKLKPAAVKFGPHMFLPLTAETIAMCTRLDIDVSRSALGTQQRSYNSTQRAEINKLLMPAAQWRTWATALEQLMQHVTTLPPGAAAGVAGALPDPVDGRNLEI